MRFLISRLSSLGDVVCSLPAAVALKDTFPDSHITWAADERFAGIVECCAAVDTVIACRPRLDPKTWPRPDGPFDVAFDLQGLFKSAIALRGLKCPRFGYHWQRELASLFSQPVTPDPSSLHIVDQYVDVVRAAGAQADRARFALTPLPEEIEAMRQLVPEGFVAVNPGAAWATKRWPLEHTAKLVDLIQSSGRAAALIGAKADLPQAEHICGLTKSPPIVLTGQTSVTGLVAALSLCSAHVGGDTGSTHLSAALGKPAVGLYSITKPVRSCPYGQIERCLYDPESLANIAPEAVFERLPVSN